MAFDRSGVLMFSVPQRATWQVFARHMPIPRRRRPWHATSRVGLLTEATAVPDWYRSLRLSADGGHASGAIFRISRRRSSCELIVSQSDRGGDEPRVCARVLRNQGIDQRPSSSMRATDFEIINRAKRRNRGVNCFAVIPKWRDEFAFRLVRHPQSQKKNSVSCRLRRLASATMSGAINCAHFRGANAAEMLPVPSNRTVSTVYIVYVRHPGVQHRTMRLRKPSAKMLLGAPLLIGGIKLIALQARRFQKHELKIALLGERDEALEQCNTFRVDVE